MEKTWLKNERTFKYANGQKRKKKKKQKKFFHKIMVIFNIPAQIFTTTKKIEIFTD